MGNARINFRANGTAVTFLQELHYYPFGMLMEGIGTAPPVTDNDYKYNGKEPNEDLGLNWSDYGARWYDAAIARFPCVDPIIDKFPYLTPYNYASNNPVSMVDLYGLQGAFFQDVIDFGVGVQKGRVEAAQSFLENGLPHKQVENVANLVESIAKNPFGSTINTLFPGKKYVD